MKTAITTRLSSYRCDMMRKAGAMQMHSVQEQIGKIGTEPDLGFHEQLDALIEVDFFQCRK